MDALPYRISNQTLLIFVRLTPNSNKDEVFAVEEGADRTSPKARTGGASNSYFKAHFKARVRAQPEKGKANAALTKLIAKWLNIAASDVSLKAGSQSRFKTIEIPHASEETIDLLKNYADTLS